MEQSQATNSKYAFVDELKLNADIEEHLTVLSEVADVLDLDELTYSEYGAAVDSASKRC